MGTPTETQMGRGPLEKAPVETSVVFVLQGTGEVMVAGR